MVALKFDMTMKQIRLITIFSLIALLISACQNEKLTDPSYGDGTIEIKMKPGTDATKALVDLTADDIYAYIFGDAEAASTPALKQIGLADGVYSYSVPDGTETIVFSNQVSAEEFYVDKTADGGLKVTRAADNSLYDTDIVAGISNLNEVDENGTLSPHLYRMNSFVTADLQMKSVDGTELNLSDYMTHAYLRLPNQAGYVTFNADGTMTVSENTYSEYIPEEPETPGDDENQENPGDNENPGDDEDTEQPGDGDSYIDPTSLITNGDFETYSEYSMPYGWTVWEGAPVIETTETHSGNYAIRLDGNGYNWQGISYEGVQVEEGTTYRFGVWVKTTVDSANLYFNINMSQYHNALVTAGDWTYVYCEYEATSTATISVQLDTYMDTGSSIYIDDVEFFPLSIKVPTMSGIAGFSQRVTTATEVTEGQTTYNLCTGMASLPTAAGMNSRLELVVCNKSGKETVMSKDLDYPFEPNRHYTFTIVMKRNETGFIFDIEDIIEEDINIDLN